MVDCPLTLIETDEPGAPEVITDETPAALPCNAWSRLVITEPLIASSETETEAPEISLFRMVPYPITTTSSNRPRSSSISI